MVDSFVEGLLRGRLRSTLPISVRSFSLKALGCGLPGSGAGGDADDDLTFGFESPSSSSLTAFEVDAGVCSADGKLLNRRLPLIRFRMPNWLTRSWTGALHVDDEMAGIRNGSIGDGIDLKGLAPKSRDFMASGTSQPLLRGHEIMRSFDHYRWCNLLSSSTWT